MIQIGGRGTSRKRRSVRMKQSQPHWNARPIGRRRAAAWPQQPRFSSERPTSPPTLLAAAEIGPLDGLQRAQLSRLRGHMLFAHRRGREAPALLLDAATRLAALHPVRARDAYVEALGAEIFVGRAGARDAVRVAEAA